VKKIDFSSDGPQFQGSRMWPDLQEWVWKERLPWLCQVLKLPAAEIIDQIDWQRNGVIVSPPGTGKNVALVPAALRYYPQVFVLVPSVVQAHRAKDSLDKLFHPLVGGCFTSQLVEDDLIDVITTGIFHRLARDPESLLWQPGTILFVDEAQRILDNDPETEFLLGYVARKGVRVMVMSATIDPSNLAQIYDAQIYEVQKQMYPINIEQVRHQRLEQFLKKMVPIWCEQKRVSLTFAPSRARVAEIAWLIKKWGEDEDGNSHIGVVTVTGADDVTEKEQEIEYWSKQDMALAIVGTPGVFDSSVTIPGLTTVVIEDRRIQVKWNEYGYRERINELIHVNHLWQMIRRVGREPRPEGQEDEVYIITPYDRSADLDIDQVKFGQIKGAEPHFPIHNLLLESVLLGVPFDQIDDYMVSDFSQEWQEKIMSELLADGAVEKNDESPTGYSLTEKGEMIVSLPFGYHWSKVVVEASDHLQMLVALAASFGPLYNYRDFTSEKGGIVAPDPDSELLTKIRLGIDFWNMQQDEYQSELARQKGMSWRRLESVETLFQLALTALGFDPPEIIEPEIVDDLWDDLLRYFTTCGLFEFFVLGKTESGWNMYRQDPDNSKRLYVTSHDCSVDLEKKAIDGFCLVCGNATWFTTARGGKMGQIDDVTIMPADMVKEIIDQMAIDEGWRIMDFAQGTDPSDEVQWECFENDRLYVVNRFGPKPQEEGRKYYVEMDREIGRSVWLVNLKFPVL